MFERVDVNVRQTTFDISLITTSVLEESPLSKPRSLFRVRQLLIVPSEFEFANHRFVNFVLMSLQRVEKSLSPRGSSQNAWIWSGNRTIPMV